MGTYSDPSIRYYRVPVRVVMSGLFFFVPHFVTLFCARIPNFSLLLFFSRLHSLILAHIAAAPLPGLPSFLQIR